MLRTLFASIAAGVSAVSNSTTNGINMSLDTEVLQQAEESYWHFAMSKLNNIEVPDIVSKKDSDMYLKDNDFKFTVPTDSVYFNNDAEDNCMKIKLRKMTAKFTVGNFKAHYGIFGAHGDAKMTMDSVELEFGYRLISQTLEDGRSVPGIESCYYNFDSFDKGDLSFEVHGSFWDGFVDMFKNTFEGKIVDVIKKTVKKEVVNKLPGDLNTLLSKNDGFVAIPGFENWWLDFMSEEGGVITDTSIEQGIRGIMFDHS